MPLQLIDAMGSFSSDKQKEITGFLTRKFEDSVRARSTQVDTKYANWVKLYEATPTEEIRTTPWYNASNFIPQVARMHTDILVARMAGVIFGTKPFWKPTSIFGMMPHKHMEVLGSWLEFECFHRTNSLYSPILSTIQRTFKYGTCVQKMVWKDALSTQFGVATGMSEGNIQMVKLNNEGFLLENLPFEDFYLYPLTIGDLTKAEVMYHRLRFSKESVEWRKELGFWSETATDFMLRTGGRYIAEQAKEATSKDAGVTLTQDTVLPFTAVEAWFTYVINGLPTRLVATFNPFCGDKTEHALLRMIFNPDPLGEHPFNDIRFSDRDDFFYGYSTPEVLEQIQEEAAQIHNARRDSNSIANTPTFKKKRLADVPNPASDYYPGKVFEVDAMDDLELMAFGGNYNSMIEEEAFLQQLASGYTGISAAQQSMGGGVLDGKRGVYNAQGTMAMLQEGSDRPNLYLKQFRNGFHKLGRSIFRYNRNYRSTPFPFELWGENGPVLKELFALPEPPDYNPVIFAIGASDGSANKEIDRTNLLLMSNTMAGYYNQLFQAVSTVASLPPGQPIRELLLQILDGAKDLADRLLYVFDIGDRNKLIPDARNVLEPSGQGGIGTPAGPYQNGSAEGASPMSVGGLQAISSAIGQLQSGSPS